MATDTRQRTTWGTRFRFLIRTAGLIGVLGFAVGMSLLASVFPIADLIKPEKMQAAFEGNSGPFACDAAWTVLISLGLIALALFVEIIGVLGGSSRRTAAGTSAGIATIAAVALLVFVNAYSFTHHARYDFTRHKQFTLPADLAERLRTLRSESPTTIVVLQKHNVFGTLSADRDSFTKGAEEKVTEKVKDLVDLFREFGPRFNVEVLDTEAFGYKNRLDELTKDSPELLAAIKAAPENSIFFFANKRVQRLAFNEFLQLDRTASEPTDGGKANLVLLPQGTENFARRVLAVQERRPKVAVCVVHEWLSTAATVGQAELSLGGLKKSLGEHGFDVIDIILKKNWEDSSKDLEPAAYTIQESKLERLEGELDSARDDYRAAQNDVKNIATVRKAFDNLVKRPFRDRAEFYAEFSKAVQVGGWQELVKAFRQWIGEGSGLVTEANEPELRQALTAGFTRQAARAEQEVKDAEKTLAEAEVKAKGAYQDERSVQDRRINDVKAKFSGLLADVDLLIIPRYTLVNATIGRGVSASLHSLSKPQIEVIKDFMKAGKPALVCLGSLSSPGGVDREGVDDLENLVTERGIELGRDTILYDTEAKAFAALKAGRQLGETAADIPPLVFVEKWIDATKAKPNPVGAALRLTGRSINQKFDLRLYAPRPVYLATGWQDRLEYAAEFAFTDAGSWNEERPFATRDRLGRVSAVPRYEPTLNSDPKWGTRQAERRGPFPVGVAIESKIPAAWVNEDYGREQAASVLLMPLDSILATGVTVAANKLDRPTQRLVVFGSGNIFSGAKLEPAQEKLLLHSVNWLTGREDRLPRTDAPAWSFPRVEMTSRDKMLWRLGTAVVLPLSVVFLGLMVTMFRRLR
jgi:hypothetical protein